MNPLVMGFDRELGLDLKGEANSHAVGGIERRSENTIVEAASATEAVAVAGEGDSWHQEQLDLRWWNERGIERFEGSKRRRCGFQVGFWVGDLSPKQVFADDFWKNELLFCDFAEGHQIWLSGQWGEQGNCLSLFPQGMVEDGLSNFRGAAFLLGGVLLEEGFDFSPESLFLGFHEVNGYCRRGMGGGGGMKVCFCDLSNF